MKITPDVLPNAIPERVKNVNALNKYIAFSIKQ